MNLLHAIALSLQLLDAGMTCHALRTPGRTEANPLILKPTCVGVITQKAATTLPLIFLKGKARNAWSIGLIAGSGIGLTFTLRTVSQ